MPGKINPVVAEAVNQVHAQVVGNDATVSTGAGAGQLDLNLYKPVLAYNLLESAELIAGAAETFGERFVARLEANEAVCESQVQRTLALATALNPTIGYDRAAEVAKEALASDRSIREVVIERGYLSESEAEKVLDPERMTHRGILGED
jgi:fumarate hydratase class II